LALYLAASVLAGVILISPIGDAQWRCAGLTPPVDGPALQAFAPTGRFSGHWGVDWGVPAGTDVRAAGPGRVTFAGFVAGNLTVTVDHGGGLRTSYSYLSTVVVERGEHVSESTSLGTSGAGHGSPLLHFSVRLGPTYVDPLRIVGCRLAGPAKALRLIPVRENR
jgi:murein DD-endopeptidase MepM/ murein hydrolase activator NlpD